jgi:hypothetical protein
MGTNVHDIMQCFTCIQYSLACLLRKLALDFVSFPRERPLSVLVTSRCVEGSHGL